VQACGYPNDIYQCGTATAAIAHDGEAVVVNVRLRALGGAVSGTLLAADGVTPVSGAFVQLRAGDDGPLTSSPDGVSTDGSGHFTFAQVPAGVVEAVLDSSTGASAAADNTSGPVALTLVRNSAVRCRQTLNGADGFRYDFDCGGELRRGGTSDGSISDAYESDAYNLRINGATAETTVTAEVEQGGRQLVYGPMQLSGVIATRRVFVPAAGGFARYLETITNPTAQAATIDVQIDLALSGSIHLLVDPAVTNNTYAVTRATPTDDDVRPALAHVFGGPAALVPLAGVHFQALTGTSHYTWRVTIPAGATITLMHFAVQRDSTSIAAADAQAQALVNLTDPNALAGMSAADKARVVNFRIQ